MPTKTPAGAALFESKGSGEIYATVLAAARARIGASNLVVDPKQTCVHFNAGKDGIAFAGLHPRKGAVLVNLRLAAELKSPRIRKAERVSAHRWHCETIVSSVADADQELIGWIGEAYRQAAGK